MSKISHRECLFIKMSPRGVERLQEEVESVLKETGIPQGYDVKVFRDSFSCCGISPSSLIIEVMGPEEKEMRALDLMAVSKILEICEKRGIKYHVIGPLSIA